MGNFFNFSLNNFQDTNTTQDDVSIFRNREKDKSYLNYLRIAHFSSEAKIKFGQNGPDFTNFS